MIIVDILSIVILMRKEERVIKLGLPQSSWEVEESGIGFMIIFDVECLEKQVPSWKNIQRNPGSLRRGVFHSSKDPALPPLPFTLF